MDGYFVGGLEPRPGDSDEVTVIGGASYITSGKFKTLLRDSIIDWGTFLEIYEGSLNCRVMFEQVTRILDVKRGDKPADSLVVSQMVPIVRQIYLMSAELHMGCLLKQFMLYEPVSVAVHAVFTILRSHFEDVVLHFVTARNAYWLSNAKAGKPNDWSKLIARWDRDNLENELESSSIILLFLNPPKPLKSNLHIKLKNGPAVKATKALAKAVKKFHYPGFCPKVPHERLQGLLKFPLDLFTRAIQALEPTYKPPNYAKLEQKMALILQSRKTALRPSSLKFPPRKKPPAGLLTTAKLAETDREPKPEVAEARLALTKWYVREIFEIRKGLLPVGKKYEAYYRQRAEALSEVAKMLRVALRPAPLP
jgi:hypothetical protein